jgi:hypothetical protein
MVPNDEQDMNSFNKISTCGSRQQTGLKKKKKNNKNIDRR